MEISQMKEQNDYTTHLERSLQQLIEIFVDPSMWNFLSDSERTKVSEILTKQAQYQS
jgi:hypothetical protein